MEEDPPSMGVALGGRLISRNLRTWACTAGPCGNVTMRATAGKSTTMSFTVVAVCYPIPHQPDSRRTT